MGGVAGHMDHLYDNRSLTFDKMVEIMTAASNGELEAEEKVDGQNLFLSYSIPEGKAKGARNKGNYRSGGLDARSLAQKFAGRGAIEAAFNGGFSAFEAAVEALSDEEKLQLFGPDTNIWYNAEIMDPGTEGDPRDPGSTNVIKYDDKTLKIHDVGHFAYNKETNSEEPAPSQNVDILDNALERMQQSLHGHDFQLARKAIIDLQKLEDDVALKEAIGRLTQTLNEAGISFNQTVEDYMFARVLKGIDTDLPSSVKEQLTKYLLKQPGNIGARALKKMVPKEDIADLTDIIQSKKMILKQAIEPIEMIVHDFTVEILKSLKSVFIADNDKEVLRLRKELSNAVNQMISQGEEDPAAMEIMQYHLNKIKDMGNITTPVEAIVFDYDGHTYKFAGNYAPLNQILGMFRYPKGGKKLTSEAKEYDISVVTDTDDSNKKIALVPGGFKPPHAGHYGLAKFFADKDDIDEVRVIVSNKSRPPVTVDMAIKLWELYTTDNPKIKVQKGTSPSPVGDVYDIVADKSVFKSGDVAVLGKCEKDFGDQRFDRAQSWAERHNPGVGVWCVTTPVFAGGVSGTEMRNLLSLGEEGKSEFKSNLPRHLDAEEKELAYNIVSDTREALNQLIDSTIEEISSMSSGAVQGPPGNRNGFGPPNTYSVYGKRKKPKVNRPKRQRRR